MIEKIKKIYDSTDFSVKDFISPDEPINLFCWEQLENDFKMKYAIGKIIEPKKILEIGLSSKYNTIAIFLSGQDAEYTGIGNDTYRLSEIEDSINRAKHRARKNTENRTELMSTDLRKLTELPGDFYDLIYIDGQRDGDSTFHELELALEKGQWILLGNFFKSRENMLSALYFIEKYKLFIEYSLIIHSVIGEVLIKTKPIAKSIFAKLTKPYQSALQDTYDKTYFMSDCGGFDSFKKTAGKKLEDPRLVAVFCLANPDRHKTILDIGCGRGELAFALSQAGADVTGIDYSAEAINIAVHTFSQKSRKSNPKFIHADFLTWTTSNQFDIIIATDLIEHLEREHLPELIMKVSKLLKKNGLAIFHTAPNRHYYDNYYPQLRIKAKEAGSYLPKNPRTFYEDLMHISEQTPEELTSLIKNNFNYCHIWVSRDDEMIGSLDKNYPKELLSQARGIFAIAANIPISLDKFRDLLTQPPLDPNKIRVRLCVKKSVQSVKVNEQFLLSVDIHNKGNSRISSLNPYPIHLSYHWLEKTGNVEVFEGLRTQITPPLFSDDTKGFTMTVRAPAKPGEYILQVTLVQEFIFWFEQILPDLPVLLKFFINAAE
jgi:2-polyprenyl-3-methyl-5-hydroxy-6-metoxy-1,4-benzoquinol methylase